MQSVYQNITLSNLNIVAGQEDNTHKILLIDDDKVDRMNVKRASRKIDIGVNIEECEDVETALSAFQKQKFDCIIIDYRMPIQDGLEGVEEFRKIDTYIPIIMITGQGDETLAVQAMHRGAHHYIPKDRITSDTLWNALSNAIENSELKRQLDQKTVELEKFNRIMTCDLKTPIRTIQSFCELIVQSINEKQYDKVLDLSADLDRSIQHMDELIEFMQTYSGQEGAEQEFKTNSMKAILNDTLNNLGTIIKEKNSKITRDAIPYIADDDAGLNHFLKDIEQQEAMFSDWSDDQKKAVKSYRRSIEVLHKEAIKQIILRMSKELIARDVLRSALNNELVYDVLKRLKLVKPSMIERVDDALETIRPILAAHGGGIELVSIKSPSSVEVRFTGNCVLCSASAMTFAIGIKKVLMEQCSEITNIIQIKKRLDLLGMEDEVIHLTSPFTLDQAGDWSFSCETAQIPKGGVLVHHINGIDLILYRNETIITCFKNLCPYTGKPMHDWQVNEGTIQSQNSDYAYDLLSGKCISHPEAALTSIPVRIIVKNVEVKV